VLWWRVLAPSSGADSVTVITDGLLYHFIAPDSGLTVANAGSVSGNWNCEGTKIAGPTSVGGGLQLATTDIDQLQFPGVPSPGDVGTICFWYKPNTAGTSSALTVGAHPGTSYAGYYVGVLSTGKLVIAIGKGSGGANVTTRRNIDFENASVWDITKVTTSPFDWVHITATFDQVTDVGGSFTSMVPNGAYFDGVAGIKGAESGGISTMGFSGTDDRIGPGSWVASSTVAPTGRSFADIRVYDRQLSEAEIVQIASGIG
jgi:hypothetical protein